MVGSIESSSHGVPLQGVGVNTHSHASGSETSWGSWFYNSVAALSYIFCNQKPRMSAAPRRKKVADQQVWSCIIMSPLGSSRLTVSCLEQFRLGARPTRVGEWRAYVAVRYECLGPRKACKGKELAMRPYRLQTMRHLLPQVKR